jgi:hypothetical protein
MYKMASSIRKEVKHSTLNTNIECSNPNHTRGGIIIILINEVNKGSNCAT